MTTTAQHPAFTALQRSDIETLRRDLTQRIQRKVSADFGTTDEGQNWALLSVEDEPLVSVVSGAGVPGPAGVMAADGSAVDEAMEFPVALKVARFIGVRQWREIKEHAFA